MAITVSIERQTHVGEIIRVECSLDNPSQWISQVAPMIAQVDSRIAQQGKAMLNAQRQIGHLSDEEYDKFRTIYAVLQNSNLRPRGDSQVGAPTDEAS